MYFIIREEQPATTQSCTDTEVHGTQDEVEIIEVDIIGHVGTEAQVQVVASCLAGCKSHDSRGCHSHSLGCERCPWNV